jgi:hypothetical protein
MKNDYEIRGDVAFIYLEKRGVRFKETIVDASDIEYLLKFPFKWYAYYDVKGKRYYARASKYEGKKPNGSKIYKTYHLHRYITNPEKNKVVDHFDGNSLNNRRSNLKVVTQSENLQNIRIPSHNTSGHRNVHWCKRDKRWKVTIQKNGKFVVNKSFVSYDEAVEEAIKYRKIVFEHYNDKRHA